VLASFFGWAYATERISRDPAKHLVPPRRRPTTRRAHELEEIRHIASRQEPRDEAALLLLGRLALRKNDLRELRLRDIDLAHDLIYIRRGKGGKAAELPIVYDDLRKALYFHLQVRGGHPDEYLLYPKSDRHRPLTPSALHRWFKRCLERAGASDFPMQVRYGFRNKPASAPQCTITGVMSSREARGCMAA
jgi:integrase